jgi:hypothetical protein
MVGIGDRATVSGLLIDFCALPCSHHAESSVGFDRIVADCCSDIVGGDKMRSVRLPATVVLVMD